MRPSSFFAVLTLSIACAALAILAACFVLGTWTIVCDRLALVGFIALFIAFVITLAQSDEDCNEAIEDTDGSESDS
jgi:hypothetical protein